MIGRQPFVEAVQANGLLLEAREFRETVRVEASTDLAAVRGADIVLFCVKTTDTHPTAQQLAPLLGPEAVVVSLQNGVDNAEQIQSASGIDAVACVVYVGVAAPAPGHIRHFGRGDLVIGPDTERNRQLAAQFVRCGVPCRVSANIEGELWTKLVINGALNAVSALGQATYGRIAESPAACQVMETIVDEMMAVAAAANLVLPGMDSKAAAFAGVMKIASQLPGQFSSTGMDLSRGKRTEIDSLNGYVARRGAELGVPTPVNQALSALVKLAEAKP